MSEPTVSSTRAPRHQPAPAGDLRQPASPASDEVVSVPAGPSAVPTGQRAPEEPMRRAGAREWAGLAVLLLAVLLVSIDNTVLSFALPSISRELQPSAATQLWIVDSYPLVLAALLVPMGNLGDRIGRRRLLLIGATGFAVVSVLAAFAPTAEALLAARIGLGVFGAALMPCTLSLIRCMFAVREQRRLAIAIWATGFSAGAAIGPIVGGVLLERFHWGSVFLIAVPLLLPLLILAPVFVTESRDPDPGPFDLPSVLLSVLTITPVVFAIKHIAVDGLDLIAIGCAGLGLMAGWLLVRRLLRQPNPLLDVRLFAYPAFTGSVLINLLSVLALIGLLFFLSQHIQLVLGLSPMQAGLLLLPGTVSMVVAGILVVRLVRRFSERTLVSTGLSLSAMAYVAMAAGGAHVPAAVLALIFSALAVGIGVAETLSNDIILASVPPHKAGAASAVSETAYEIGAVLGTSILGGVLTASYRGNLQLPAGLSADEAGRASETLAGALQVSEQLGGVQGAQLAEAAKSAFDSGVVVSAGAGALLVALAIGLAVTLLRQPKTPQR
ncbi:MFS transporter [Sediminivirga luteola]|uniref:MFS transporter n=2 Tax=Sediminivirga luteola TaxID=1774748 RepID=A0A8J2XLU9_9MICO|nr:MFS transporter [Sediminivirga luteola]